MAPGPIQLQRKSLVLVQYFGRWISYLLPIWLLVACNVPQLGRAPDLTNSKTSLDHTNFIRGVEHLHSERYRQAISEFNLAVQKDATDGHAYLGLAAAKTHLESFDEALADYDRAIRLLSKATRAEAHVQKGYIHYQLENYQEAWTEFNSVVKSRPDVPWWYMQRGIASAEMENFDKALQDLDRAIQLQDSNRATELDSLNSATFYYVRGLIKHEYGCPKAALADYDKALELSEFWRPEIMEQIPNARILATYQEDSSKCSG